MHSPHHVRQWRAPTQTIGRARTQDEYHSTQSEYCGTHSESATPDAPSSPALRSLRKSPICVRCRISRATDLSLPLLASDKVLGLHRTRCVLERSQELPQSMKTCSRGGARLSSPVSPDALRRTGQCRGTIMQRCKWLRLCDVPVMDAGVSWTVALFSGAREGTFNLDSLLARTLPVPIDACPG